MTQRTIILTFLLPKLTKRGYNYPWKYMNNEINNETDSVFLIFSHSVTSHSLLKYSVFC